MRWVIGDVHGCYDEFIKLVNEVRIHDKDAKFVLVGDIIDRGPKTFEMLKWAMDNVDNSSDESSFMMCIGNHEHMKIKWWSQAKGDLGQYDEYGFNEVLAKNCETVQEVGKIIDWFKSLPYVIQLHSFGRTYYICHACIPRSVLVRLDGTEPNLSDEEKESIVWDRVRNKYDTDATVVFGHTPTIMYVRVGWRSSSPFGKVDKADNFVNVDCGLVYRYHYSYANLAAYCLDTEEVIYLYN